jgi:transcriptional regulator with XRE-family HTH domain
MEMTTTSSPLPTSSDFSNRASAQGRFSAMPTIAGVLVSLVAGPGAASVARPVGLPDPSHPQAESPPAGVMSPASVPARELIAEIKQGWSLNMTELAELMGVQRPTLYNWLKGKTSPDAKLQKHLQTLAAAAADWQASAAGSNWDFLLDYTGPRANEVTIRELLGRADVSTNEIRDLVQVRMEQYQEAYARSREILGEPTQVKGDPIRESTRKLNKRWTENARKLHRARNASR